MTELDQEKDDVFKLVQKFLRPPPVIIWGSGATIPYGLPSMARLENLLKPKIGDLKQNENLESQLGKIKGQNLICEVRKLIMGEVLKKDLKCLKKSIQNPSHLDSITKMLRKFHHPHPNCTHIVTTNYDRVLEYALSREGLPYTDGFSGDVLSKFNKGAFGTENIINVIKVHGSLNWVTVSSGNPFFLSTRCNVPELEYVMIIPSTKKYEEASKDPYRTLITKADEVIDSAKSFLVVGFGFNDEHLTPKIESRIAQGIPIVIITKKSTDSCKRKLDKASESNYCLFEKDKGGTKATLKKGDQKREIYLNKDYWKLNHFMEIF